MEAWYWGTDEELRQYVEHLRETNPRQDGRRKSLKAYALRAAKGLSKLVSK